MLGLSHHRCRGGSRTPLPRAVGRVPLHVQRHHGGRRTVHERLYVCARERRQRRASSTKRSTRRSFEGFRTVAHHLALGIVRGGEGATKLVSITVTGAATEADAWLAARAMANSPLVKTAVHGADPNWGRLVAATGRSGAAFVLDQRACAHRFAGAVRTRPAVRRTRAAGRDSTCKGTNARDRSRISALADRSPPPCGPATSPPST